MIASAPLAATSVPRVCSIERPTIFLEDGGGREEEGLPLTSEKVAHFEHPIKKG